jgi:hypothetical protein
MNSGTQVVLFLAWIFMIYLKMFLLFALKLFVIAGIFWGFILNLSQFPSDVIGLWQTDLQTEGLSFWGAKYFEWIASNWWQIVAILVFIISMRNAREIGFIRQTSYHAAFIASSFEKYFDATATSKELLNLENKSLEDLKERTPLFEAAKSYYGLWKIGIESRAFSRLTGLAFSPDEIFPVRGGKKVNFRDDSKRPDK